MARRLKKIYRYADKFGSGLAERRLTTYAAISAPSSGIRAAHRRSRTACCICNLFVERKASLPSPSSLTRCHLPQSGRPWQSMQSVWFRQGLSL